MSTPSFAFPQSLAEKYRPMTIDAFIGLEKPKRVLKAFSKRPASGAWLFVGPSGTGKSSMGLALASELAAELHHVPSQRCNVAELESVIRQCWYVPSRGQFHVVLIDEADAITNQAQLFLLSKMDSTDPPPATIFILTANGTDRLEPRFLSRCKTLHFSSYGLCSEIVPFLDRVWHAEGGNGNCPDLARVVKESRNNVRDCLQTLEVELLAT